MCPTAKEQLNALEETSRFWIHANGKASFRVKVTWNVPEWLYMSLQGEAWQARHSGPCHLNLCMINPQTGQQSFDTLEDARSIRDLAYDIYKVLDHGKPQLRGPKIASTHSAKRSWRDAQQAGYGTNMVIAASPVLSSQDQQLGSVGASNAYNPGLPLAEGRGEDIQQLQSEEADVQSAAWHIEQALLAEARGLNCSLHGAMELLPALECEGYANVLEHWNALVRALKEMPAAARSQTAFGAALHLEKYGLHCLEMQTLSTRKLRPQICITINVLDLLKATGCNPHFLPHTVIADVWESCRPETFHAANESFSAKQKEQPYSQHLAEEIAAPLYPVNGLTRQQHIAEAKLLMVAARADAVTDAVHKLHLFINQKMEIAQFELVPQHRVRLRMALCDDIRSIYQRHFGEYNKPGSIEVFKQVASGPLFWEPEPVLASPSSNMLMREFTFEGSNINLLVKGSPDYIWSHGLVKLKNRMYAEAAMDNKYRTGDHAESCIYHVLAQVYPKFAYAKRYMVEHIRVGESGSLAVDCRDVQFITGPSLPAELDASSCSDRDFLLYNAKLLK
ncbi:hypothetical protein WJX82_006361 [Trebouxia sp. C0006]